MSDYTELVKALRHLSTGRCEDSRPCELCAIYETCLTRLVLDAAAAIEALLESVGMLDEQRSYWIDKATEYYNQLPKRGEWIVKGANRIDCSVCGHSVCFAFGLSDGSFDLYKYCPECGAKMEVQDGQK